MSAFARLLLALLRPRLFRAARTAAPPRRLRRCRACAAFTWRDDPVCLHCGAPR